MIINNNNHCDFTEKMRRCQEYIAALEEEQRKIQVFQRELPLSIELVSQAIEACKQQLSGTTTEYFHGQSECSEQTSMEGPVLEEFIPIKRAASSDDDEQQSRKLNKNDCSNTDVKNNDKSSKKSDWLRSVQLWNQTPDPPAKEDSSKNVSVMDGKKNGVVGGAFHPFKKEKSAATKLAQAGRPVSPATPATAASSSAGTAGSSGGETKKEEKEGQSQRKARRCWSPELHRRFLQALQQLGGSNTATPKQIRELMKVDGLTNDEVKSHLQKYRLHTRRPNTNPSIHNTNHPQPPQFVVVGGIWVPPEYSALTTNNVSGEATGVSTSNAIYAPVATLPGARQDKFGPQNQSQLHSDERGTDNEGRVHSNSPASSSSTHSTTASPPS